jgi:hypothetical protein
MADFHHNCRSKQKLSISDVHDSFVICSIHFTLQELPFQKIKNLGNHTMTYTDLWVRSLDYDHGRKMHSGNLRNTVKKIRPITEGEGWRIRTNKEIKDILQGDVIIKFIKSILLR